MLLPNTIASARWRIADAMAITPSCIAYAWHLVQTLTFTRTGASFAVAEDLAALAICITALRGKFIGFMLLAILLLLIVAGVVLADVLRAGSRAPGSELWLFSTWQHFGLIATVQVLGCIYAFLRVVTWGRVKSQSSGEER